MKLIYLAACIPILLVILVLWEVEEWVNGL